MIAPHIADAAREGHGISHTGGQGCGGCKGHGLGATVVTIDIQWRAKTGSDIGSHGHRRVARGDCLTKTTTPIIGGFLQLKKKLCWGSLAGISAAI